MFFYSVIRMNFKSLMLRMHLILMKWSLNDCMDEMLDTPPPGLDEAIANSKVIQFLKSPEYNMFTRIVFDIAPTGHTLRLLSLPDFLDASIGKILKLRHKISSSTSAIKSVFGKEEKPDYVVSQFLGPLMRILTFISSSMRQRVLVIGLLLIKRFFEIHLCLISCFGGHVSHHHSRNFNHEIDQWDCDNAKIVTRYRRLNILLEYIHYCTRSCHCIHFHYNEQLRNP